jgi:hypothetical protein
MTEALRQREPRETSPAFLNYVRRQPCCVCGGPPLSEAAHVKMGSLPHGKRPAGGNERPSDRWAVPLCADCHREGPEAQHRVGERQFWEAAGLDPFALAIRLWNNFNRSK